MTPTEAMEIQQNAMPRAAGPGVIPRDHVARYGAVAVARTDAARSVVQGGACRLAGR